MANKGLTLNLDIPFNAPLEKVWQALIDPELVQQYFFGTRLETTWEVGKPIFWRGEWEGTAYEDKGTVLAFDPPRMLKYNYWSSFSGTPDVPENYADITYALRAENGQTILTIIQEGIENEEKLAHSEQNWRNLLAEMAKML